MRHPHETAGMQEASGKSKPGYAALRKGRCSLAGQIYLVTFTTRNRRPLFADHEFARLASHALSDPRLWQDAHLRAWVLMPDHWHGLIELGNTHDLSAVVRNLKSNTARRIRLVHPDIAMVWEKGFQDHALRKEEAIYAAARYLVLNPIRAGLASRVGDYPYWNADRI